MTEDEAKTKWCPFARSLQNDGDNLASANRGFDGIVDVGSMCIASECMAWRYTRSVDEVVEKEISCLDVVSTMLRDGYCGLAGNNKNDS